MSHFRISTKSEVGNGCSLVQHTDGILATIFHFQFSITGAQTDPEASC